MEPRSRANYVSDSIVGKSIQKNSQGLVRVELNQLRQLRQREKIQALATNTRDHVRLEDLASHRIAFYSGLAVSCVAVAVVDFAQHVVGASHYQTLTAHRMDELYADSQYSLKEKQKMMDEIDILRTAALFVPTSSRKATIAEAVEDAIVEYGKVIDPNSATDGRLLISGIGYASPNEVTELTQFTNGLLNGTGIHLEASQLGIPNGIYTSLNHSTLSGCGFYNSSNRQKINVGSF